MSSIEKVGVGILMCSPDVDLSMCRMQSCKFACLFPCERSEPTFPLLYSPDTVDTRNWRLSVCPPIYSHAQQAKIRMRAQTHTLYTDTHTDTKKDTNTDTDIGTDTDTNARTKIFICTHSRAQYILTHTCTFVHASAHTFSNSLIS